MGTLVQFAEKLKTVHVIWIILIIGIVVYARMLGNGFVGDDVGYINHPYIQNFQLLSFFQSSSADLGGTSPITGQFFRPLMLVLISSIYQFAGQTAFLYHLVQLLLHLAVVITLFFFYKHFFSKILAGSLALLFLLHPINVETVAYISDLQDVLFVLFGLLSLVFLLSKKQRLQNNVIIAVLLGLSLLSKETGILFFPVLTLATYLFRRDYRPYLLHICLPPLLVYGVIRAVIASVWIGHVPHSVFSTFPLSERLLHLPDILSYYLVTTFYPVTLIFGQTWSHATSNVSSVFALPLVILFLLIMGISTIYIWKFRQKKFALWGFFFSWFILGLLLHIQLLPLEMTVADRWFYFPFVGLLGMFGTLISLCSRKVSGSIILIMILLLPILAVRTYTRTGDWRDSLTLYAHDKALTDSYILDNSYGYELMQLQQLDRVEEPLKKSIALFETTNNTNTLGVYYYKMQDYPNAIVWMQRSISLGDNFLAYSNLARIYIGQKDYGKAIQVLEKATKTFPTVDSLWYLLALTYYQNGDRIGALSASETAYKLTPTQSNYTLYTQLRNGQPIIINE